VRRSAPGGPLALRPEPVGGSVFIPLSNILFHAESGTNGLAYGTDVVALVGGGAAAWWPAALALRG